MNSQERTVAAVVLASIALAAVFISFSKPRLGNFGLTLESAPLTNELGKVVRTNRVSLPPEATGFKSVLSPIMDVELTALPADTHFGRRIYGDESGFKAQLSAVMMQTDRTSIHRPHTCVTGQGWKIDKSEVIDIPIARPEPYTLKATCLTSSKEIPDASGKMRKVSSIYIYWFVSEKRLTPAHPEALWYITQDLIATGVMYPWAYVGCFATCLPGQEQLSIARMKRLIGVTIPEFQLTAGKESAKQTALLPGGSPVN